MSLEKLKLDVAVRVAVVDKSLTKVEAYRKQLQENARKLKEDIHGAVDRQVGSLRGRERQLVRQVEVVTAHQNCLLSTRQAGLMHSQGALTATKNLLHRCTSADAATISKIKMDEMLCTTNVRPVNLVSVQLQESALSSAIGAFGSVQLPETITHHPSPVIPAKVEEYEDEDHDVLHKSVAGAASGPDSPVRVTVQFPRLNQQNWLIGQKEGNSIVHGSPSVIQKAGDGKCNVSSWLSNLQISGSQDEEDNAPTPPSSIGSFDLMSNYGSTPVLSSKSSSIEIVPSHFDSEKEDCSTVGSTCEIENLPSCLGEKSRWLSPSHMPSEKSLLQRIKIAEACQANEPCSNFSECLCNGDCADSALQKAKQSAAFQSKIRRKRTISEVYGTNSVLSHMADILSSDNSDWLMKGRMNHSHRPGFAKKAMYEAPGEKWLCRASSKPAPASPQMSHVVLSTHSNIWLLHKLKAEKGKAKEEMDEMETEKIGNNKLPNCELTDMFKEFGIVNDSPKRFDGERVLHALPPVDYIFNGKSNGKGSASHPVDNKLAEDNKLYDLTSNKRPWLVCSPLVNTTAKHYGKKSPPPLPESILSIAQAGLESWLMKKL